MLTLFALPRFFHYCIVLFFSVAAAFRDAPLDDVPEEGDDTGRAGKGRKRAASAASADDDEDEAAASGPSRPKRGKPAAAAPARGEPAAKKAAGGRKGGRVDIQYEQEEERELER